jgi:nucleoside phosphorylase
METLPRTEPTILIFVALAEEHDRLLQFFPHEQTFKNKDWVCVQHKSETLGCRLVSILSKDMGIDNAHEAVSFGVQHFSPNLIVCLGIAGSLSNDLNIGDICISSEIVDISQNMKISEVTRTKKRKKGQRRNKPQNERPETRVELSPKYFSISADISATFRFLRSNPELQSDLETWKEEAGARKIDLLGEDAKENLGLEPLKRPVVEIGPIICGPVVANSGFKQVLKKIDRKVLAIETESSGICRAAGSEIPFIAIRGISDLADPNKNALERTTKQAARQLAADNAITYFKLQLRNESFLSVAEAHLKRGSSTEVKEERNEARPEKILARISEELDTYLLKMSPEYKLVPNKAKLPIPRIYSEEVYSDYGNTSERRPRSTFEALSENRRIFIRLPKSFPNQTFAWSIGQSLLNGEIDGKQALPIVLSGDELSPPSKGILHAIGIHLTHPTITQHFTPIIIINEPQFNSAAKITFLISEIEQYPTCPVLVISRAENPTDQIDRLKADLGLTDHSTAPVPFYEIATYLETAFEMTAAEADTVASRLDETFSKFRLHTHPAYFAGLQEATLDALIEANQRAELIQLAVDGLLSFVVVFDESRIKLSRTTREEFLANLAFEIRVEKRSFTRESLYAYVRDYAEKKALEIQGDEFLRGYFSVGLLNEIDGYISFSVPFLESYLLSERLRTDSQSAESYFDPFQDDFDQFTFDLYVERGACDKVIQNVCAFAQTALRNCDEGENVYTLKQVKPRALSNSQRLINLAQQLSEKAGQLAEHSNSNQVRKEKQKLIDTKQAVHGRVAQKDPFNRNDLPEEIKTDFQRLDALSRATTLLATLIGSGAERLDGAVKVEIANLILKVLERFLHHWTLNRMGIDFNEIRTELSSEAAIDQIIQDLGLYEEDRGSVKDNLLTFLDDQELRLLSGPGSSLFNRLSQYASVRSLRPIFANIKANGMIERLFRDAWLMDVEFNDGKKALKNSLQHYKGSPLLRLVVTTHLMNRVYWHHWQRESKRSFVDVARYSLAPLGLKPSDEQTQKVLKGPKS